MDREGFDLKAKPKFNGFMQPKTMNNVLAAAVIQNDTGKFMGPIAASAGRNDIFLFSREE